MLNEDVVENTRASKTRVHIDFKNTNKVETKAKGSTPGHKETNILRANTTSVL